jgi:hypothetical protein
MEQNGVVGRVSSNDGTGNVNTEGYTRYLPNSL